MRVMHIDQQILRIVDALEASVLWLGEHQEDFEPENNLNVTQNFINFLPHFYLMMIHLKNDEYKEIAVVNFCIPSWKMY